MEAILVGEALAALALLIRLSRRPRPRPAPIAVRPADSPARRAGAAPRRP